MNIPTLRERLFHIIELTTNWLFAAGRRKGLNNNDFSIISNNCWYCNVYEYFGWSHEKVNSINF